MLGLHVICALNVEGSCGEVTDEVAGNKISTHMYMYVCIFLRVHWHPSTVHGNSTITAVG